MCILIKPLRLILLRTYLLKGGNGGKHRPPPPPPFRQTWVSECTQYYNATFPGLVTRALAPLRPLTPVSCRSVAGPQGPSDGPRASYLISHGSVLGVIHSLCVGGEKCILPPHSQQGGKGRSPPAPPPLPHISLEDKPKERRKLDDIALPLIF